MRIYTKNFGSPDRRIEGHRIVETPKGQVYVFDSYPGDFWITPNEEPPTTVVAGFFKGYLEGSGKNKIKVEPVPKEDQAVVSSAVRAAGFKLDISYR
jgi:hypothetical protein